MERLARIIRRTLRAGTLFPALLLCAPAARAGDPGKPGGIFDFGAGARPLGMGGAYAAEARDATALYYNPAGLSLVPGRNVAFMRALLYEGATYDYLGYAQNYGKLPGAWGFEVMKLGVSGAEGRDELNAVNGSFGYTETAFAAGTGLRGVFLPSLSAGIAVKAVSRQLDTYKDNLVGLDLGLSYGPLYDGKLNVAFTAQSFGSFASGDTEDKLPFTAKLGAAYRVTNTLLLCTDLYPTGGLRFGGEYLMGPAALRLGYYQGGFAFGAGFKFLKSYNFDYAMVRHEELGLSSRFSLGYFFGTAAAAPPKVRKHSADFVKRAERTLTEDDYVAAEQALNSAIGMDPEVRKGPWGDKLGRIGKINTGLNLRESEDRRRQLKEKTDQAQEANRALQAYIEGNAVKSMLLAHSASGYAPNNALFSDVLKLLGGLNSREIVRDEVLPRPLLVNSKIDKASSAFYAQNFEKTVKECNEVLLIDEKNASAWKKLGSAYYALGDLANARRAYEKVLELNPEDESVLKFMAVQGWR